MDPTTAIMGESQKKKAIMGSIAPLSQNSQQNKAKIRSLFPLRNTDLTWEENARRGGKWSKPHQKNGDMVYIYILQDSSTEKGFAMIL
jgi:hypothetical protein